MRLGIMQPYFFPYIGYMSLIKNTDLFILFDDVQFIRHGWIERNRILKPSGGWQYIAVPLEKHHRDTLIKEIRINADKVKFTGNKWNDKVYLRYTGYPGGQREMTPAQLMKKPNGEEKLLKRVVKGMLPKNRLGAQLLGNLYVYAGSEHKHEAQTPKSIDINSLK